MDGGLMKTMRAWMMLIAALVLALAPLAAQADDRGVVQQTVEDNWVEEVPTPWVCLFPPFSGICFPPW
jgi:ABC-type sugar transport system substrate-binding protein